MNCGERRGRAFKVSVRERKMLSFATQTCQVEEIIYVESCGQQPIDHFIGLLKFRIEGVDLSFAG